jgi:glutaredoxin
MRELTLYGRSGCHLCDFAHDEIEPLCAAAGVVLRVVDVDVHPHWRDRYGTRVPVVCAGDLELTAWPIERKRVLEWLGADIAPAGRAAP